MPFNHDLDIIADHLADLLNKSRYSLEFRAREILPCHSKRVKLQGAIPHADHKFRPSAYSSGVRAPPYHPLA